MANSSKKSRRKFLVFLYEKRKIQFEVEAESPKEAKDVAIDAYTNDERLQDEMLKDESIVKNDVKIASDLGPADGIVGRK